MRRAKRRQWHIDQLTKTGNILGAWAFPGDFECDLVEVNSALPIPIAGFGSSV
jgi:Uri superfamily endonuclease